MIIEGGWEGDKCPGTLAIDVLFFYNLADILEKTYLFYRSLQRNYQAM